MGTFDIEQRLEYLERELEAARKEVAELQSLLRAAAVVGIPSSDMRPGAKITDVLAAHGYAITALTRRVGDLEAANEQGVPLG